MCPSHLPRRWAAVVLLLALAVAGSSCAKAVATGPRAWIDFPRDGASGPPDSPVPVVCRASAPKGVAEVLLSVDGADYRRNPPSDPGASLTKVTFDWLPAGPGVYTLQVRAFDTDGAVSSPDTITVRIEGEASVETATQTLAPSSTPTATATGVTAEPPTATPTSMPTRTPTSPPTLTPTATVPPPAQVKFGADRTTLVAGECALLQWWVQNATAVYLNGEGVVGEGTRSVCPATTTTYTLHVEAPGGNVDESITITVTAPSDTTAPPVPAPQVPAEGLVLGCKTTQTLAWLPVTDPSGIAGYDVRMEYETTLDHWEADQAWDQVADKQVTAEVQCGLFYRWRVRARDGAGNYSDWSPWRHFSVELP